VPQQLDEGRVLDQVRRRLLAQRLLGGGDTHAWQRPLVGGVEPRPPVEVAEVGGVVGRAAGAHSPPAPVLGGCVRRQ
jgi:hypothetical protein